jgi:phage baseplate assembly protein W
MNTLVADTLAADLATIPEADPARAVPAPGYGVDLVCVTDVTPELAEVIGQSPYAIAQAIVRRLITPRGGLLDDPDYGLDLRSYVNRGITLIELARLQDSVRGEVQKDDRVSDARVDLSYDAAAHSLRCTVTITPVEIELGTFTLTFNVSDAGALLESIR